MILTTLSIVLNSMKTVLIVIFHDSVKSLDKVIE
jgi:hypothetical protein